MRCTKCKTDNAPLKKCCSNCGTILSGVTINNVTGQKGIRNPDGTFTPTPKPLLCTHWRGINHKTTCVMNHFEINGKLLEVSLILCCDVYDLIEVKNEIVKKGRMNADDRSRLRNLGLTMKDKDFFTVLDEMISQLSYGKPICTDGHASSVGRKLTTPVVAPER